MRRFLLLLALLAALLAGLAATRLLVEPPAVRSEAETGQFAAARAKARLAAILGDERPHPADSFGSDAVRARLVAQIRAAGLNPIVRDQFACNEIHKQRGVTCARVRNVMVALGPPAGNALLLNTHYDSTPVGPAAADAGAGVATLLEVGSILKDERLQRPVLLLFNEGEELGLVGARAFLRDPLSGNVDSLVNLEARGTTGPVTMFETSLPNGPPVRAFAEAVDRPFANSLATDFYRQLPNYTDVNSFEERGWTTLNFAMIGNETRYHSAGDNLAALDLRSLQHMGDQALAVARELAAGAPAGTNDVLFADVAGRQLIVVPDWLGYGMLDLLAAVFAIVAFRRGGLWRGLALVVAGLVVAGGLGWLGVSAVGLFRSGDFWRAFPIWTHVAAYACGLAGAVAALALSGRKLTAGQLRASFWLAFLILGVAVLLIAPGGVIYFLLPPLAMLVGIVVRQERIGALIAALLLWLTLGEVLALLGDLMVSGPFFIFAGLAMLVAMPWLIEAKALIDDAGRLRAIAAALLLMAAGWAAVATAPAYSANRQQRFSIQHISDCGSGRASWLVINDGAPLPEGFGGVDEWKRDEIDLLERKGWVAQAPALQGARPPRIQPLASERRGGGRIVRYRIQANGAERITLLAPKDAEILSAGAQGYNRPIARDAKGRYAIACVGRSCDGAEMQLTTRSQQPLELVLVGLNRGLPLGAEPLLRDRPANARPQYVPDSTLTLSRIRL